MWKKDIQLWSSFTDLPKEKVAITVHLSLKGKAQTATTELSIEELKCDAGLNNLLIKLNNVFLQVPNWKCFNCYLAFDN